MPATRSTFVGSLQSNYDGPPAHPDFDLDHEGHSGWRADQLLAGIGSWASTYRPDVVLMHAGSNDMFQSQSVSSTISELSQIIDRIRAANPYVKILLAKLIPPTEWYGRLARVKALNDAIPGLVTQKHTTQSPVILVDQSAGFYAATDTFDGIHTNVSGENKMAARWYEALTQMLPKPPTGGFSATTNSLPGTATKPSTYSSRRRPEGAKIQQWSGHGGANQQWSLQSTGDGTTRSLPATAAKRLTVSSTSWPPGSTPTRGSDSQQWKVESPRQRLLQDHQQGRGTGLDVDRAYTHDGAVVLVWTYSGAYNQQWRLRSLGTTARPLAGEAAPDETAEDGLNLFPNPGAACTTLAFRSEGPGAVRIVLTDATGRAVITLTPHARTGDNHATLDLSKLRPGLYTLQLHQGNQITTRKLAVGK
jgi:hypothetical protein